MGPPPQNKKQLTVAPEKMHSTTEKWSSKPYFQALWILNFQAWVMVSRCRCSRWFMIPRCQIWWQKTLFYARNWAWKRLSKWPASCSRIWWQTLGPNKQGRKVAFGPGFSHNSVLPGGTTRGAQEETGQRKSEFLPPGDHFKTEQLMLGKMLQLDQFEHVSFMCMTWCWNVNEPRKRDDVTFRMAGAPTCSRTKMMLDPSPTSRSRRENPCSDSFFPHVWPKKPHGKDWKYTLVCSWPGLKAQL